MQWIRRVTSGLVIVALSASVGACSSDDDTDAAPSSSTTSSSVAADPSSSTVPADEGCPATTDAAVPAGTPTRPVPDLDGDGVEDEVYVGAGEGSTRTFGVITASGARTEWSVDNASPVTPSFYGAADADHDGRVEIFVNPGRVVYVLTLMDCVLEPYLNVQGEPYGFDVGFTGYGTGVGCTDADGDGRQDLLGLLAGDREGDTVGWERTIVRLEGDRATNGPTDSGTFTSPADDEAIALLGAVTCGEVRFGPPLTGSPG